MHWLYETVSFEHTYVSEYIQILLSVKLSRQALYLKNLTLRQFLFSTLCFLFPSFLPFFFFVLMATCCYFIMCFSMYTRASWIKSKVGFCKCFFNNILFSAWILWYVTQVLYQHWVVYCLSWWWYGQWLLKLSPSSGLIFRQTHGDAPWEDSLNLIGPHAAK